jgi:hypothetical protein
MRLKQLQKPGTLNLPSQLDTRSGKVFQSPIYTLEQNSIKSHATAMLKSGIKLLMISIQVV